MLAISAFSLLFCTGGSALKCFLWGQNVRLVPTRAQKIWNHICKPTFNSVFQMWSPIFCSTPTGQMAAPKPSRKGDGAILYRMCGGIDLRKVRFDGRRCWLGWTGRRPPRTSRRSRAITSRLSRYAFQPSIICISFCPSIICTSIYMSLYYFYLYSLLLFSYLSVHLSLICRNVGAIGTFR